MIALLLVAGCGNKAEEAAAPDPMMMPMPPPGGPAGAMPGAPPAGAPGTQPAAAPAASGSPQTDEKKYKFSQLTLDSTVKKVSDKQGLAFLDFRYTDVDGKVYQVHMPAAMADGEYSVNEWLSTFSVYRLPEVIKQKNVAGAKKGVSGFPFISPKPNAPTVEPSQDQPRRGPVSIPMPPMPGGQPGAAPTPMMPPMPGAPPAGTPR